MSEFHQPSFGREQLFKYILTKVFEAGSRTNFENGAMVVDAPSKLSFRPSVALPQSVTNTNIHAHMGL